jgi:hypothetical protein
VGILFPLRIFGAILTYRKKTLINPVPRGITGSRFSWGIWIREPGPPGLGSLRWDRKVWLRVVRDSGHWVITLQIADPSSRQRGRPTETRPQISDSNIPTGSNIWSQVPQGCSIPRHTDRLTVSLKVTSPHPKTRILATIPFHARGSLLGRHSSCSNSNDY